MSDDSQYDEVRRRDRNVRHAPYMQWKSDPNASSVDIEECRDELEQPGWHTEHQG